MVFLAEWVARSLASMVLSCKVAASVSGSKEAKLKASASQTHGSWRRVKGSTFTLAL